MASEKSGFGCISIDPHASYLEACAVAALWVEWSAVTVMSAMAALGIDGIVILQK